jgi:uncharacterized protein YdaU (DUF1376 family)
MVYDRPKKLPIMPWWHNDYTGSTAVQALDAEEERAYFRLLMAEWELGPLPKDDKKLARLSRADGSWQKVKRTVLGFFTETNAGYINAKLEDTYKKSYKLHCDRRKAGKKGAEIREQNRQEKEAQHHSQHGAQYDAEHDTELQADYDTESQANWDTNQHANGKHLRPHISERKREGKRAVSDGQKDTERDPVGVVLDGVEKTVCNPCTKADNDGLSKLLDDDELEDET